MRTSSSEIIELKKKEGYLIVISSALGTISELNLSNYGLVV